MICMSIRICIMYAEHMYMVILYAEHMYMYMQSICICICRAYVYVYAEHIMYIVILHAYVYGCLIPVYTFTVIISQQKAYGGYNNPDGYIIY